MILLNDRVLDIPVGSYAVVLSKEELHAIVDVLGMIELETTNDCEPDANLLVLAQAVEKLNAVNAVAESKATYKEKVKELRKLYGDPIVKGG